MNDKAIIIFIKNPVKGKVKTRLAKDIGDDRALAVYCRLLDLTEQAVSKVDADKHLFYSDHIDLTDNWANKSYTKHVQYQSSDLGERMYQAFKTVFDEGYTKVLIIGSDCPEISTQLIEGSFDALDKKDVVIGPAADGGYYLLGMSTLEKKYFEDKEWSTSSVRLDTIRTIEAIGKDYLLLKELRDLDNIADLEEMKISLFD